MGREGQPAPHIGTAASATAFLPPRLAAYMARSAWWMRFSIRSALALVDSARRGAVAVPILAVICNGFAAMAARKRIHIGIGVIIDRLPAKGRRLLHALWCALQVAFALVLLVVGTRITRAQADVQMVSIDFSFWPVYLVVPIAAAFFIVYALRDLSEIVTKGDVKSTEAQL